MHLSTIAKASESLAATVTIAMLLSTMHISADRKSSSDDQNQLFSRGFHDLKAQFSSKSPTLILSPEKEFKSLTIHTRHINTGYFHPKSLSTSKLQILGPGNPLKYLRSRHHSICYSHFKHVINYKIRALSYGI
jgi:hypothetical protein